MEKIDGLNLMLTKNTKSERLWCGHDNIPIVNNQKIQCQVFLRLNIAMSSIEKSHLSNLRLFNCSKTNFVSLNFSNMSKLESISCSRNNSNALINKNLPILKYLYCSYNSLQKFTIVDTPQLEVADCRKNVLKI